MLTVLIGVKNEIDHIERCLEPLYGWAHQIIVIDSNSTDGTAEYLNSKDLDYVNFDWNGRWPKKRQWALDNVQITGDWVLLLDADEILTNEFKREVDGIIKNPKADGYLVPFDVVFLDKKLRYGDSRLYKLALFKRGSAGYVQRIDNDDNNLDMEVHEHVALSNGNTPAKIDSPVKHYSVHSVKRILDKYNDYSDWEVKVFNEQLNLNGLGKQASIRRLLKKKFLMAPFSDIGYFVYLYVIRLGILDGISGYHRARLQSQQIYMIKLKLLESKRKN